MVRLIAALVLAMTPAQQAPVPVAEVDIGELSRLESAWNDAHLRGDAAALEGLWADDLVIVVPRMKPLSRSDALEIARSGRLKFSRYQSSELGVRVYADTCVVTGRIRRSRERGGQVVHDDWRFTKIYVRRAGAWRVALFHASEAGP